MKIAGIILIIFGFIDVGGSWLGFDLWTDIIGINLPNWLWHITGYAEIGLGFFLFNFGDETEEEEIEADNQ